MALLIAFKKFELKYLSAAILIGGLTSIPVSFIISYIVKLYPFLNPEGLSVISEIMVGPFGIEQLMMFGVICFLVPLYEELLFRGLLWSFFEHFTSSSYILVGITSVLFAAAHLEPLHVMGVLPVAILLGLLRYHSKSVVPGIIAHSITNILGLSLMMMGV